MHEGYQTLDSVRDPKGIHITILKLPLSVSPSFHLKQNWLQGRKSVWGGQAAKIIFRPIYLKMWEGPYLLLL